jgi:hypothetical protein
MAKQTLMAYDQVHAMANTFQTTGEVLAAIGVALDIAIAAAHAAAFFSFGASEALATWLEGIKPHVDKLSKMSYEVHDDIESAIKFVETGDTDGSRRFC